MASEHKESFINAVIIGNVNAGKSSLCGRIAYHLGYVSGDELLEYRRQAVQLQRESYYLAWWSDRADIEREKGITIHNHFHCWQPSDDLTINITDISGYEYYLKNAIVGCALNDIALLLIDINEHFDVKGIQQLPRQNYMGSVLQQLLIVKALNISKIIVVLNKCDLFLNDAINYKHCIHRIKNTIIEIAKNLKLDLNNTFYPHIVPISTINGWNICTNYHQQSAHFLLEHLQACNKMDSRLNEIHSFCSLRNRNGCHQNSKNEQQQQHKPLSLLEVLSKLQQTPNSNSTSNTSNENNSGVSTPSGSSAMKAIIKRVSITKDHLLLLYCIVIDGVVHIEQKIRVHPYNIVIPIFSMQSFKKTIGCAYRGQLICVAVRINDIDPQTLGNVHYNIDNINYKFLYKYFQRGSLITDYCDDDDPLFGPIEYFEAELNVIYAPYDLRLGYQLSCYSHCTHFRANLIHCFDKSWNDINCMNVKRDNVEALKDNTRLFSGEKCIVGFNVIDKQIVLMNYDEYECLGWIVIKDHKSYIVATGKILYAGRRVTGSQIFDTISQIPMGNLLSNEIIHIISCYACCGT